MPEHSSINVQFTQAQRKVIAELLPILTERLKLGEKNPRTIPFARNELDAILQAANDLRLITKSGMKRNSLRHIVDAISKALKKSEGVGSIPISDRLYQFKITLIGSKPPTWRRIQVKNGTLDKLHEHIQTVMGWTNSHLHQFKIDGEYYGDPELLNDGFDEFKYDDSTIAMISQIVPKSGKRFAFKYEYDFGDCWEHEILFEGCLRAERGSRYPVCLEGERACPPEDVGGIGGYALFLQALADPGDEEHEMFMEWAGPFNPDLFDARKATKAMRRGLPDWRSLRDSE